MVNCVFLSFNIVYSVYRLCTPVGPVEVKIKMYVENI